MTFLGLSPLVHLNDLILVHLNDLILANHGLVLSLKSHRHLILVREMILMLLRVRERILSDLILIPVRGMIGR
jgi:hypothetical protein